MKHIIYGHGFVYEVQAVSQIFFPNEKFLPADGVSQTGVTVVSGFKNHAAESRVYVDGVLRASDMRNADARTRDGAKKIICAGLYAALRDATGAGSPWGTLTGVKPTKIINGLLNKNFSDEQIVDFMRREYLTDVSKIKLCIDAARGSREIIKNNSGGMASLYVSVPYCASRCLYCSFTSYGLNKGGAPLYLDALRRESEAAGPFFYGKKLNAVYVGGGTPTALDDADFFSLLKIISDNFPAADADEYTVEAGRPDTITRGKLRAMKKFSVTRISINPQTMDDATLKIIGRRHTAADVVNAFALAREEGFTNINADLIMGLPCETAAHAKRTMDAAARLMPESVTVHTLSVKRASRLKGELDFTDLPSAAETEEMLGIAREGCERMGMKPYYLYRQKNTSGNFENVGYGKEGYACVYNAQITEEKQTIIALGAGSVTKIYYGAEDRVERVFNAKPPDVYINRIDEYVERKKNI